MTVIAVLSMGEMGASLAARMARRGARVITSLRGRSAASVLRAQQGGVADASDEAIASADYLLSVVPPREAFAVAESLSGPLAASRRKPVYLDCNAISVHTVRRIGEVVRATGARFVDASIIGPPGRPEAAGPSVYLAGELPGDVAALREFGLAARSTGGPEGAASALKMAYAGFNKGLTALAAAMVLQATRAGAAEALRTELGESQPHLLNHIAHTLPDMYAKAWRWDFEMQQVAEFAGSDADVASLYRAMGAFYARFAEDWGGPKACAAAIDAFLQRSGDAV